MKKTLIAAAALAFVGAASAQVTMSGTYGFQVAKSTGAKATFGMHDAAVKVSATDDLGGGMKVTVAGQVNGFGGRNAAVATEDTTVALSGAFGTVTLGDLEFGNGIMGRGQAGAPLIGADNGSVLSGASTGRMMKYAAPAIGGVNLTVSGTQKAGTLPAASYTFGASTTMGALAAGIDYNETSKRVRISASYDLGMAKVGFGSERKGSAGDSYTMGVSTMVGAATVGAAYSKNTTAGGAKPSATEVGLSYPLSKRTSFSTAYQDLSAGADTFRVRLTSTF